MQNTFAAGSSLCDSRGWPWARCQSCPWSCAQLPSCLAKWLQGGGKGMRAARNGGLWEIRAEGDVAIFSLTFFQEPVGFSGASRGMLF